MLQWVVAQDGGCMMAALPGGRTLYAPAPDVDKDFGVSITSTGFVAWEPGNSAGYAQQNVAEITNFVCSVENARVIFDTRAWNGLSRAARETIWACAKAEVCVCEFVNIEVHNVS